MTKGLGINKGGIIFIAVLFAILIIGAIVYPSLQSINYSKEIVFDKYNIASCSQLPSALNSRDNGVSVQGVAVKITTCRDSSAGTYCICEYEPLISTLDCDTDSDCSSGRYCYNSQLCLDKKDNGVVCTTDHTCESNYCSKTTYKCADKPVSTPSPSTSTPDDTPSEPIAYIDPVETPACEQALTEACNDGTTAILSDCIDGALVSTGITCDGELPEDDSSLVPIGEEKAPEQVPTFKDSLETNKNLLVATTLIVGICLFIFILLVQKSGKKGKKK